MDLISDDGAGAGAAAAAAAATATTTATTTTTTTSIGATTLGGFWPALRFRSTNFYLYTFLSNVSLSSLNLLLPV